MPFDSVGVAEDRPLSFIYLKKDWRAFSRYIKLSGTGAQFGGGAKERQIEGLVDFPMKLPKLSQTCPEFCMRFYLTKRVERRSDIIDGLFLFYLELYILNSVVI